MKRVRVPWVLIGLVGMLALVAAACAPAPEPTTAPPAATTAPPTATTAPVAPVATTAAVAPTVAVVAEVKLRPVPVLQMPPPNPKAKHGGIFRSVTNADPPDFGIWDSSVGSTLSPALPVTDSLLNSNQFEPNKRNEIIPGLAYDWWINEAGEKWTFKLREGIKFTDGVGFTCADAKFSLDTIRLGRDATGDELRRSPKGAYLTRVTEIRCPDDYTLEILTDGPLPSLAWALALAPYAIMPKHIYEGNLDLWLTTIGPGLGPFIFESYSATEIVKLKRNPDYWDQPYPYLDGRHIINVGSAAATQAAFRVGRAEQGSLPKAQRDQAEKEGKILVEGKVAEDGFQAWHPNWRRKPWSDPRFARALRCAIDGKKHIATVLDGEAWEGPIFPLATTPGGSEWAITKEEWKAIDPCHGPTEETDMAKRREIARGLMKELGFGSDNPARPDWIIWSPGVDPWIPPTEEDMKAVGIEPKFRLLLTAQYYSASSAGEFDVTPGWFLTPRFDPDHWLYEHYYSTSNRNYGGYVNAEVDALIDQQSRTLDKAERYKILKQIEKLLLKENAKIVLNHFMFAIQLSPWVRDVYRTANNESGIRFHRAWIDQDVKKSLRY